MTVTTPPVTLIRMMTGIISAQLAGREQPRNKADRHGFRDGIVASHRNPVGRDHQGERKQDARHDTAEEQRDDRRRLLGGRQSIDDLNEPRAG